MSIGCWSQPGGRQIYAGEHKPPESSKRNPKARRATQNRSEIPRSSEHCWPQRLTKATKLNHAFMNHIAPSQQMNRQVPRGRKFEVHSLPLHTQHPNPLAQSRGGETSLAVVERGESRELSVTQCVWIEGFRGEALCNHSIVFIRATTSLSPCIGFSLHGQLC